MSAAAAASSVLPPPPPALLSSAQIEILDGRFGSNTIEELFGYEPGWGLPNPDEGEAIVALMARAGSGG